MTFKLIKINLNEIQNELILITFKIQCLNKTRHIVSAQKSHVTSGCWTRRCRHRHSPHCTQFIHMALLCSLMCFPGKKYFPQLKVSALVRGRISSRGPLTFHPAYRIISTNNFLHLLSIGNNTKCGDINPSQMWILPWRHLPPDRGRRNALIIIRCCHIRNTDDKTQISEIYTGMRSNLKRVTET